MDKLALLDIIGRREKKLKEARRFRPRRLATDPRPETLWPALNHARRFVQPAKDGSGALYEGGLDSKFLEVDESTMSAGWVISAVRRDRHGDVVIPKGCVETLADYQANPQVFFAHKSDGMPVGLAEKDGKFFFDVREDDIISRCFFHGSTEESDKVFDLVAKRILRAASIGFFPVYGEVIPGSDYEEGDTEIDFDMGGLIFHKWSIIEWSVVSVPANPDALRSWLCRTPVQSSSLKRTLEPFATPLKRNQVVCGWLSHLPSPLPIKESRMPADPMDPNAPDPTQPVGGDVDQERENSDVQALLFHNTNFHSSDECVTWLEENGYSTDNLMEPDEAEEPWVAIQFEASQCEPETAYREELEPGVEAVCCVKKAENDEEQPDKPAKNEDEQEEPQIASARTPRAKAAEPGMESPTRGEAEGSMPETPAEEEESAGKLKPHGAQVLEAVHGQMCALHDYMTEALQVMEHPQVKKAVEKLHGKLGEHIGHVESVGEEHYPDHFDVEKHAADGDPTPEEEEEEHDEDEGPQGEDYQTPQGEQEEEEEDDDKKPKRKPKSAKRAVAPVSKMARKDVGVISDVKEFLAELSEEDNLKKSQKAACRLHEQSLGSLCTKYAAEPAEEKTSKAAEDDAEQQQLVVLHGNLKTLADMVYELTGLEVEV